VEFLHERYSVDLDTYNWNQKFLVPLILTVQFFKLLTKSNANTVYVVMFAGFWSVIPTWLAKTFGRKAFIIVGGTDCVSFPEFNYGSMRKGLYRKSIEYSLKNCTAILPVSSELVQYDYTYFDAEIKKQGYLSFFPDVKTPHKVIYNGYEIPAQKPGIERKPNSFITVAKITNSVLYELKGIDVIRELATRKPELSFTIVGISESVVFEFRLNELPNLKCVPFVGSYELDKLYREHQFYMCLSLSEGFPNALSEGMSYGCVPIGSNVSAIPFIIGKTGFVLDTRDGNSLLNLTEQILQLSKEELSERSTLAKERIRNQFSLEKRKVAFYELIG